MGAASPLWWRNVSLQAELPRWWYVLDGMTDGRYWTTTALKKRMPWMPPSTVTATAVVLHWRGHIEQRPNPRYLVGLPHYRQPTGICPNLLRITAAGRMAHAGAKAVADRLAAGEPVELLPTGVSRW